MSEQDSQGEAFPLEWFPGQLFPDIELAEERLLLHFHTLERVR